MSKIDALNTEFAAIESEYLANNLERAAAVGFEPEKLVPTLTYVGAGVQQLTDLAWAMGMESKTAEIVEIFRSMTSSWRDRQIGAETAWQSDVSDDRSPFEFSIAMAPDKLELRILTEAQGEDPNLQSNWQAGLNLNHFLAERFNINLDRFRQIEDLFAPTNDDAKFAIWHSACFYPDKDPAFKIYLNPRAQSPSRAAATIEAALVRLGFSRAWSKLNEIAARRGPERDEFIYFSLDLATDDKARVKVYLRHHNATTNDLEAALSLANNYSLGDATEFCEIMTPGQTIFTAKPVISCFSWVNGDIETPSAGILHVPISNYAANDAIVRDRLDDYFERYHLPVANYHAALAGMSNRNLDSGIGMHSYTSLRTDKQTQRVTIYLNPEINGVRPAGQSSLVPDSSFTLAEMVLDYEARTIAAHPCLQRLKRESVNQNLIWLLFMNIREAVVTHFTRRLANVVGRLDEEDIRSILTKQLNEELGNGDLDRIHRKLFDRLLDNIDDWKLANFTEEMLAPGREYSQELEKIYLDSHPYAGVGAALLMEVQGKQFDIQLAGEFRRSDIDLNKVSWLTMHEELELDHADEALTLAGFIDNSTAMNVAAARIGMENTRIASWRFLDRMYELFYGQK